VCGPIWGDEKLSALRKILDASPGLSKRRKGSRGYSLSLITPVPSPNANEVKMLWLVKNMSELWATYSFAN